MQNNFKAVLLFLIVIATMLLTPGLAEARTPTRAEWENAARQEASRECLRRERAAGYVPVGHSRIPRLRCVRSGAFGPGSGTPIRPLSNMRAVVPAEFTMELLFYGGRRRHFAGNVHLYVHHFVWRTRLGPHGNHIRVRLPVIGVIKPVGWFRTSELS